ncbi:MAG: hypothetical protein LUE64_05085 [Candidatus Gastranaerophilales bacterium]|nr:hypothetical protein [Candidatus Gastranaerophilales bacterium]
MNIFSSQLFLNKTSYGIWEKVTTFSNSGYYFKNLEYNSNYNGYFLYSTDCKLAYSADLINWEVSTGCFIYDETNEVYYKITSTTDDDTVYIYISKMLSWGNFDESILLESFNKSTSAYFSIQPASKLGDYTLFPYYNYIRTGSGTSATYDCYQKICYTKDFTTWNIKTYLSESGVSTGHYQQTSLGSSGEKFILFSATENGFCPMIFTSPTSYETKSALWTAGNMTAACGFYLNGIWYYCSSYKAKYKTQDGTNYTTLSNSYINPFMLYYNEKYITSAADTTLLCIYDSDFSSETYVSAPTEVKNILGILNNKIYIMDTDGLIFSCLLYKTPSPRDRG